jgi:hypothetical protein
VAVALLNNRSRTHFKLSMWRAAAKDADAAIALAPNEPKGHYLMGMALQHIKGSTEHDALVCFQKCQDINPDDTQNNKALEQVQFLVQSCR